MKNTEIVAITDAYAAQKGKTDQVKLPVAVAWKRRLNMEKLTEARRIIDEAVNEIQSRFADDFHSTEKTGPAGEKLRQVKPEYMAEFVKAQMDIMNQDTDVTISKVPIEALGDIALTDRDMDALAFMIQE